MCLPAGIEANFATYASLLRSCGNPKSLPCGKRIHAQIIRDGLERHLLFGSLLVQTYSQCGALEDAVSLFSNSPQPYTISWNFLIRAYGQHGEGKRALLLFEQMQRQGILPDVFTFVSVLSVCACDTALYQGRRIHAPIVGSAVESDVVVGNALINLYGKCGSLVDAQKMFGRMAERNIISWNAIISVHAQNGQAKLALELFDRMQLEGVLPDKFTFVSIIDACACQGGQSHGNRIQAVVVVSGLESHCIVGTALMNMYGKFGNLQYAWRIFCEMLERDVVSWNAIISAYVQNERGKEALILFDQMLLEVVLPNRVTFISVLEVCALHGAFNKGKRIHALIVAGGFQSDVVMGTGLVNMYGKCGSLKDAWMIFDKLLERNVVAWTTILGMHAQHGQGKEALNLFVQMQQEGIMPNEVTFVSMLSACSHSGLVDEGCHCLLSMMQDHSITASVDHYNCMIDLLGRAGQLDEAEVFSNKMSVPCTLASFMTLLGSCRYHADAERGERVAKCASDLEPGNSAPYIMLSNIYAAAGRAEDAGRLINWIKANSLAKQNLACNSVGQGVLEAVDDEESHIYGGYVC